MAGPLQCNTMMGGCSRVLEMCTERVFGVLFFVKHTGSITTPLEVTGCVMTVL